MVKKKNKKHKYTLEELVSKITPDNRYGEIDWGPPVGKEKIPVYRGSLDLEKLRKKLIPYAQKKKYFTDENIFGDKTIS